MKKKGQIGELQPMIVSLVAVGIVLTIGFLIMAETIHQIAPGGDPWNANTTASNASVEVIQAMSDIPPWLPIIVITVIGALLIGLVAYFRSRT